MKINTINQSLKELYKGKETNLILGFEFGYEKEIERCMSMFRSGYWSVAPFAFEDYNDFVIKLTPGKELFNSQIMVKGIVDLWTISPDLKSFITMSWLRFLNDIDIVNDEIKQNWCLLEEISLPFREYTNSPDSLDFLKMYINDQDKLKCIENSEKYYADVYLDFWNHYYDTLEQKAYNTLIKNLVKDPSYLPDFEIKSYGVWTVRVYNALAQRAYSYDLFDMEDDKKAAFYWQSFIQPHGFDAESYITEILPPKSARSESQIVTTIGFANPDRIYQFPKLMQEHPLFESLEQIIKSPSSYNGDAHIAAAKVLDKEHNDPIQAWNALVSAGYWSGVNFNEPNIVAWKAAIDLSHKHGWAEINEILKDQLEFYNHYKDRV